MPQQEERLSGALQENLLTALCFDDEHCKLIRAAITPNLFDSAPFREVAGAAIDFIDQYDEAIKEHLPDALEHIIKGEDKRKARMYERLLDNLHLSRDTINPTYIVSELQKFVRLQTFKSGLIDSIAALEDGRIDDAQVVMEKAMQARAVTFAGGLDLSSPEDVGRIFDNPEEEGFELGIPELDRKGIYPRRKELYTFIAPRKKGKSWFLTHCAKRALLQRWSVLIVSLEMSEPVYGARMLQSFFSISRHAGQQRISKLMRGRDGKLESIVSEAVERDSMSDPTTRARLMRRTKEEFARRKRFRIKAFPMNSLTLMELESYLDQLERFEGFTPDLICLDYPRLMKHDAKNLRIELGQTIAGVRGIAGKRNAAAVIVHQGNRESETATWVTADMAEEDISIVASSDTVLTYSQTRGEYKLGLARLTADYVRNAEGKDTVLITQSYALGQFCLDSMHIGNEYWDLIKDGEERRATRRRREDREGEGE